MDKKNEKQVFKYVTESNAAPFVSDTSQGDIEATGPLAALEQVVRTYDHPCGLFSAAIFASTHKDKILARYLSARAATQTDAPLGLTGWKADGLYVDGKKVPLKSERYELLK